MDRTDVASIDRTGNVARLYERTVDLHGEQIAVETREDSMTHEEVDERSSRFAGGLHDLGLEPGDRVLVYLPNCAEYVPIAIGAFKAGTPISPVNPQYKRRELSYQLEDTDADAIITHPDLGDRVTETLEDGEYEVTVVTTGEADAVPAADVSMRDVDGEPTTVERDADDIALQPYTSGTTGRPKGVLLTHGNMWAQGYTALGGALGHDLPPAQTRSLIWLPMYHITGFTHCAWQPLVYGGRLVIRRAETWDPEAAMRAIEDHEITNFIGVMAMYSDFVNSDAFGDYDLTSLESALEGGAKMSVSVQRDFESVTGVEVAEGYGLTETNGATHFGIDSTYGPKIGTVGQPLRMTDSKVVDEEGEEVPPGETGEIVVRGPQVAAGYHNMPAASEEAFTETGYFRSGDIGRRDEENYYEIVDRKKHVIVTAGYNVYPSEVEELLHEHEAIAVSAVVGIPDERRNEIPKAFVVPAPGFEPGVDVTAAEIRDFCLENLAEYKHPREVEFVEGLPRTASGKVQKFELEPGEDG